MSYTYSVVGPLDGAHDTHEFKIHKPGCRHLGKYHPSLVSDMTVGANGEMVWAIYGDIIEEEAANTGLDAEAIADGYDQMIGWMNCSEPGHPTHVTTYANPKEPE